MVKKDDEEMVKKGEKGKFMKMKGEVNLGVEKDEVKLKGKLYSLGKMKIMHGLRLSRNYLVAAVVVAPVVGAYWYVQ